MTQTVPAAASSWVYLSALALALTSCSGSTEDDPHAIAPVGSVAQAFTDTDSDGMDDDWEVQHFGNLSQTSTADFDSDGMTNGEEYLHGFIPTSADSLEDADGDRYPNIFEIRHGGDPHDPDSKPTPNFVVDGTGGGTHTTVSAAVNAANVQNGAYQIIGIKPGVYTGAANFVTLSTSKPKFLVIGLEGAAKTVIDGEGINYSWYVYNTAVISSLTFRKAKTALYISASSSEVRLVDLLVRDNASASSTPGGVYVYSAAKVHIHGSTFLDNTGNSGSYGDQIYVGGGAATIQSTVVWGQTSGVMLVKGSYATLTTNYCLVKGQTLTGTGNLAGTVDPKVRSDGHVLWDSPLRSAGGGVALSRVDMDGELRPSSAPDMGVDQFVDSDADDVADTWELDHTGNLTTLTGRTQDADGDGLTNEEEHASFANPIVADTDGDGLSDGDEVHLHGTSPTRTDTDGDEMPDAWEVDNGLAPLVANGFEDADGDRYPNVFEYVSSTDPADMASKPSPNFVVDGTGGGTHLTVSAAVSAANAQAGTYKIIGIAPGVYAGGVGLGNAPASKKFLLIGLEGASKTVLDGGGYWGTTVYHAAVLSSLTLRNSLVAVLVNAPSSEVRLIDLLVRDNASLSYASGVHVSAASSVHIVGSTFLDNTGPTNSVDQIHIGSGAATITNTVVWGKKYGPMLTKATSATLTTNHCLVKGQTLSGTGNLSGALNPELRSDGRLRSNSPLRGAGASVMQSRIDTDGDVRPLSAPDIGMDQWSDADSDGLPDGWEIATFGSTATVDGTADDDSDGLSNAGEYDLETNRLDPDTDDDGVSDGLEDTDGDGATDGFEVAHGMNPRLADTDDVATDLNHDGLIDSIGFQLGHHFDQLDNDGDGVANDEEVLACTDPFRSDSDGDGTPDNADVFPHDPLMSSLPSDPQDVTAPVITLTAPWYAVEQ